MTITLSLLLYIYGFIIAVFGVFAIIHILHLLFLAVSDSISFSATVIFLTLFIGIILQSWILLAKVDWDTPIFESFFGAPSTGLFEQK